MKPVLLTDQSGVCCQDCHLQYNRTKVLLSGDPVAVVTRVPTAWFHAGNMKSVLWL